MPFEAALLETVPPPQYQQIAQDAVQMRNLGLSMYRIARKLGVDDKTVAKAIRWHRNHFDKDCPNDR